MYLALEDARKARGSIRLIGKGDPCGSKTSVNRNRAKAYGPFSIVPADARRTLWQLNEEEELRLQRRAPTHRQSITRSPLNEVIHFFHIARLNGRVDGARHAERAKLESRWK